MRYDNPDMSSEAKETHLEFLLAQSDNLADAISLTSLRSNGELTVVADKGREILRDVAYEGGPEILKGPYESVPIIGRREEQELEDAFEGMGKWLIPQLELQLEMNLAVIYTALIYTRNQTSLVKSRGQLVKKAHDKLVPESMLSKMQWAQRFGAIRYLDASSFALGIHEPAKDEDVSWQYEAGRDFLSRARDIAQGYGSYPQFMAVFNLGRLKFLKGENRDLAREYLQHARFILKHAGNEVFSTLVQHYLDAVDDDAQFGTVIDDPPEYKASMMKLVTEVLKPEERLASGIILP